jgi:hypothetical protein
MKVDFAVPQTWCIQQSLGRAHVDPRRQGKEKEKKGCLLLARAGLSSYLLCRLIQGVVSKDT